MTWLDGIERQSWGINGGFFTGGPPKGVIHTTETRGWPGYSSGKVAPHLTLLPLPMEKRLVARQHIPLDFAARALRNEAGGVQTNRDSVRQIELVGTCDPAYAAKYPDAFKWYEAPEWALAELAKFVRLVSDASGIPLTAVGKPWLPYPQSYGSKYGQRLSLSEWDNFTGWCGHQHVPENAHGDPGSLNMPRVIELAGGDVPPIVIPTPVPVPRPDTPTAPHFPLPSGHVFGPRQGDERYHSGYFGADDRNNLRKWQAQMRHRGWNIGVDGLYGNETRHIAVAFQKEKFGNSDGVRSFPARNGGRAWTAEFGLIGPNTWAAAWTAPIT